MPTPDDLRAFRLRQGVNQEFMAARLRVSVGTYSEWELGKHAPTGRNLRRLVQLMGRDVEVITQKLFTYDELKELSREVSRLNNELERVLAEDRPPAELNQAFDALHAALDRKRDYGHTHPS